MFVFVICKQQGAVEVYSVGNVIIYVIRQIILV